MIFEITKDKMNKITDCYPPKDCNLIMYFESINKYHFQSYWYDGKPYVFKEYEYNEFYPTHWIALK
jgi:hypothetical protein